MDENRMDQFLRATQGTSRLSREHKRELAQLMADMKGKRRELSAFRDRAFEQAREQLPEEHHLVLNWLELMIKPLMGQATLPESEDAWAWFSPGDDCLDAIRTELGKVRKTLDICVFTITDDRLAREILAARQRGVKVRIISDNDKSFDMGSDVERFHEGGIEVRMDRTDNHMHHKFAIFDGRRLLTGSYNWTRSAAQYNEENVILLEDDEMVAAFQGEFDKLWEKMVPFSR